MKITKTVRFTWWQVTLLKVSVLSFGIILGSLWPALFLPYLPELLFVTVALGLYLGVIWWKQ
jgi:hypothetical protein